MEMKDKLQQLGVVVFNLSSQTDSIVNYELEQIEFKNDYWTLDFLYLESTRFFMPQSIETFYVNDRIVHWEIRKVLFVMDVK